MNIVISVMLDGRRSTHVKDDVLDPIYRWKLIAGLMSPDVV